MNFSILISTHNQSKYLSRCINSCFNQNYKFFFEIIVCDTSKKSNLHIVKNTKRKNFQYFHKNKFSNYPVIDQILKNFFMFKKSKGKTICFLDGDDFFFKNKLSSISKIITDNTVYHDLPTYILENYKLKRKAKVSFLKKYFVYNKLINNWPIVMGTSCLFANRKILDQFFKNKNTYKYNNLAIDSKLAIFSKKNFKYKIFNKYLTYKSVNDYNLDNNFNNFFSKIYWIRRNQQLNYSRSIGGFELNINFIVTKIVFFFIRVF
jgi:glycosyltransferase involved in cell wall biosynthesis